EIKNWYIKNYELFENSLNGNKLSSVTDLRKDAIKKFEELNFHTIKDEEWKYTNIAPLLQYNFLHVHEKPEISNEQIKYFLFNGIFSEELSSLKNLPDGVEVKSIAKAISLDSPLIKKHFGKYSDFSNHIFTSLSTAYTKDGVLIHVPEGKIVEQPIHILFITS